MSEDNDYTPAPAWKGHDFGAARAAYDRHVGSSYGDAVASDVDDEDLIEESITTKAKRPLVLVIDQTGSMGTWPVTMFSKLPYMEHETQDYLGEDAEICFAAIGDATTGEKYPLQVQPFASGAGLSEALQKLVIVKQGGNNDGETYELAALYMAHNMHVDPMAEPIVIFIGDEPFLNSISVRDAKKYSRVDLQRSISGKQAFYELRNKASVYLIQKPYGVVGSSGNAMDPYTKEIHDKWAEVLGADHIAMLSDPGRVVDVIFGILANEVDRVDDFRAEIEGRQKAGQVKVVYKSLKTIHAVSPAARKALRSGDSVMLGDTGGGASSPLLGT